MTDRMAALSGVSPTSDYWGNATSWSDCFVVRAPGSGMGFGVSGWRVIGRVVLCLGLWLGFDWYMIYGKYEDVREPRSTSGIGSECMSTRKGNTYFSCVSHDRSMSGLEFQRVN